VEHAFRTVPPWPHRHAPSGHRSSDDRVGRPLHRHGGHRPPVARGVGRNLVVAEAAGRQHAPGGHLSAGHGVGVRVLGRLPDGLRALPAGHRRRPAHDPRRHQRLGVLPFPAVRHRRDPEVLQLLPSHSDDRTARGARNGMADSRRARRTGVVLVHAGQRNQVRADGRPEVCRPPLHVPGPPRRTTGGRLRPRRADDRARADRSGAGGSGVAGARRRRGNGRRGRSPAVDAHRVRHAGVAPDALVRPAPHAGQYPARLRQHPPDHAAPVRPDPGRADRARAERGVAVRILPPWGGTGPPQPLRRLRPDPHELRPPPVGNASRVEGAVVDGTGREQLDGPPNRLRHRALPLAHQAVLRS